MMNNIKKGDTIRIKENLMDEFIRCGFSEVDVEQLVSEVKGKTRVAFDVWQDVDKVIDDKQFKGSGEWYVTIDLCCEIPLAACELEVS
jgi:hypothetical protein